MAIRTDVRLSPGWWMDRLFRRLSDHKRYNRLQDLHDRYLGDPPLPEGADNARELFQAFQRKSRTNYAQLAVSAVSERMRPVGFRTAVDNDETGDEEARKAWDRARMNIIAADVHDKMLNLGEAYVTVGFLDERTGVPIVTCEDPRFMVGEPDPQNPYVLRAALKFLRDDIEGEDRAYLYLPGEVWVARRAAAYALMRAAVGPMYWSPETWDWVPERSGTLGHDELCVVPFFNKDGMGEYEPHIDVLDRINHQTLNRLCIAALQAYKQRAIESPEGLDDEDDDGNPIDYSEVFTSDPAAIWMLPAGSKIWESTPADLRQILEVTKDDVLQFAAVSRTPMYYLNPGGANQSADGAAMQRESLIFKTSDRIDRASPQWAMVMALIFQTMGQAERADLSELQTLWASPQRLSLSEKATASAQLKDIFPYRSLLREVFDLDPGTIERMVSEKEEEDLAAAQRQALLLAQTQQNAGPNAEDNPDDQSAGDGGEGDNLLNNSIGNLAGGTRSQTGSVPASIAR